MEQIANLLRFSQRTFHLTSVGTGILEETEREPKLLSTCAVLFALYFFYICAVSLHSEPSKSTGPSLHAFRKTLHCNEHYFYCCGPLKANHAEPELPNHYCYLLLSINCYYVLPSFAELQNKEQRQNYFGKPAHQSFAIEKQNMPCKAHMSTGQKTCFKPLESHLT